jgi:hypothetical protein
MIMKRIVMVACSALAAGCATESDDTQEIAEDLVTSDGRPTTPTNFAATAGTQSVRLSWNAVPGATNYHIWSGTSPGTYFWDWDAGNVTTFVDPGTGNGQQYYFTVRATNSVGMSAPAVEATALPIAEPVNVTVTPGNHAVTLRWTASAGATNYHIWSGTSPGTYSWNWDAGNVTSFRDPNTVNGVRYHYVIRGTNFSGASNASSEVSAVPTNQVCTPGEQAEGCTVRMLNGTFCTNGIRICNGSGTSWGSCQLGPNSVCS